MKTRTLYIPAPDLDTARRLADRIEAGRMPLPDAYLDEKAAGRHADTLNLLHGRTWGDVYARVYPVISEQPDEPEMPWIVDRVGDFATAVLLVVGGCFAVGWATL